MFLAVLLGSALKYVFAIGKCVGNVAHHEFLWRHDQITVRGRLSGVCYRSEFFDINSDPFCRFAGKFLARCQHDRDRHTLKMNFAVSQQRLVRHNAADLVLADDVFRGNNAENAFGRFSLGRIYRVQFPVGDGRIKNASIKRPLDNGNVVQINRLAANV